MPQTLLFSSDYHQNDPVRDELIKAYRMDESAAINTLLDSIDFSDDQLHEIELTAEQLVVQLREQKSKQGGLDAFLAAYDLSTEEGIVLMCIAEAMLRIPDNKTIDSLIRDKLTSADWKEQLGKSDSLFVNVATWTLMLTGRIIEENEQESKKIRNSFKNFTKRASEPVIRKAVGQAMKILGQQFVMGRTIQEALKRGKSDVKKGYTHSFDMLGEAARTNEAAERYFNSYQAAIVAIGEASIKHDPFNGPGISIKLSALYPRYEFAQQDKAIPFLTKQLLSLALLAKQYDIGLTVDAEEADRLGISLDIIKAVFLNPKLNGWQGFGLAVQAYQKRAFYLIDWLRELAEQTDRRIIIRLVKGAYWDSEIKRSQELGLPDYPVFTRKMNTDVSYIACAQKILQAPNAFYAQFATHNPQSLAVILQMATADSQFEFQCLHGMGQSLYDLFLAKESNIHCRIYAPVGNHHDLLPYLVRRLLENGANSSFVNMLMDKEKGISDIIADPVAKVRKLENKRHHKIPLPKNIFGDKRLNSNGIDLSNRDSCQHLQNELVTASEKTWQAQPIVAQLKKVTGITEAIYDPAQTARVVGKVINASADHIEAALTEANAAQASWDALGANKRADILDNIAEQLEANNSDLMYLAVREAGKTIPDALAELREAVDFCRYYAEQARLVLAEPMKMPGPTGESNFLQLHGRGVVACISPWNFPLAIFTGQVVAALVAGNCVIAKPAEQTPLIATLAVQLFHQAGVPDAVLQLLPGAGETVGAALIADLRVNAVIFTGSTEVAKLIQVNLAKRPGEIVPLIAETGGQNCMLIDSSALPEQVIDDVVNSAFGSAGQRCSALRVLYVQEDIADKVLTMLVGAMQELTIADPSFLATDVGPVIDHEAQTNLQHHINSMSDSAKLLYQVPMSEQTRKGTYVAPVAFEINSIKDLQREVFGPILHVVRFKLADLNKVLDDINSTGYGLTFGMHSRVEERIRYVQQKMKVGNMYVNRNMVGAVVGVQPFGGEGLSGTGPKAGGPHYLPRLCVERTITINTTASGGNASLLSLTDD